MRCPKCQAEDQLDVQETRRAVDGTIRRRRRCRSCRHAFTTIEHISSDRLHVRKSDGSQEMFDRTKLHKGILKSAVRKPDPDHLALLVETIAQTAHGRATDGVIGSDEVGLIVLEHLQEVDPVTHVRYALTQLGRVDQGRPERGWRTVEDARRWLRDSYPRLEYIRLPPGITEVVKRNGQREPYERQKLERSIGVASKGRRPSDEHVRSLADKVREAVEEELRGQAIVTSGQLAAEVIRSLRKVDPIAAVRFASTAKHFNSVEDYEIEAIGLQ